jgi:hypothetical protein
MSGIYLTVWEDTSTRLLNPTKGGYPHVTVAYTGKSVSRKELIILSKDIFESTVLKELTITAGYVNSFVEADGRDRHDVLLSLSSEDEKIVENCRKALSCHKGIYMGKPHITAKICTTKTEAKIYLEQFLKHVPFRVSITGITID